MGTMVPRIQVTLKPESYARITRLAELTSGSKSKLISELVDEVSPHLDQMLSLLEAAASVKSEHRDKVQAEAETLLDLMRPHAEQSQAALRDLAAVLEPLASDEPPSSNTGVVEGVSHCKTTKRAKSS